MASEAEEVAVNWYAQAFGELYPLLYAHRSLEAAAPEAEFAFRQLALDGSSSVLDLCCGAGRHMAHLAARVGRLVGLDYSPHLLRLANSLPGLSGRLIRGDMRAMPFVQAFDAVLSFFTSLGYFRAEADNRCVLEGLARALKPGGRFLIDHANRAHVLASLQADSVRWQGDLEIREHRWISQADRRVNKRTTVRRGDSTVHVAEESVRLYDPEEMEALLASTGLCAERLFGDFAGAPFSETRSRMILVGRKT